MSFPGKRRVDGLARPVTPSKVGRRAIIASVVLLALAGCAAPPAPNNDSPQESQQKLLGVLDRTQDQIGGTWDNADSPSPTTCALPGSSDKGVTFTGARTYTGSPLADAGVKNLITSLEAEGFQAGQAPLGRLHRGCLQRRRHQASAFSHSSGLPLARA